MTLCVACFTAGHMPYDAPTMTLVEAECQCAESRCVHPA